MAEKSESKKLFSVYNLVLIAMFSALAFVLMFFEFPLIFLAPDFYKLDLSELPVLIGAFSLGPVSGIIIEIFKILLHLLFKGTSTAYVGEIGNLIVGIALIVPAAVVYRLRHNKKGAIIGLVVGILVMVVSSVLVNAYLLLPWYADNFFGSMDPIIQAGNALWPVIHDLFSFTLVCVAPFNLVKGLVVGFLTVLLYKHISRLIHRVRTRVEK